MLPVIKDKIAYYIPQGFIDGNNAPLIMDPLGLEQAASRGIERIVVSLERVVAFNNRGIAYFAQMFQTMRDRYGLQSAMYGYSPKLYEQINHFFGAKPPIDLYENARVMALFLGRMDVKTRILLFASEALAAGVMTVRLKELGYQACESVRHRSEFITRSESGGFDVLVDRTQLAQAAQPAGRYTRGNTVVYTAEANFDDYAARFDRRYHRASLAAGFSRFVFESSQLRLITPRGIDFLVMLAVEAAEYGATIVLAGLRENQIPAKLLEPLGDMGIETAPDFAQLMAAGDAKEEAAGAAMRKLKPPAKELIARVGVFLDATVHTLEALSGTLAARGEATVCSFKEESKEPIVSAVCGFYGQLAGLMVLAFPHGALKRACRFMVAQDEGIESLPQAAGDLTAIIMSRIVARLAEAKIELSTTQPRVFETIEALEGVLRDRRGVKVPIRFGEETFYFFLSR